MKKKIVSIMFTFVVALTFGLAGCGVETPAGSPSAPQNFTVTAGDTQVILTWTPPSDKGDSDITKYEVSKDNGSTWTDAGLVLTYTFSELTNGTNYTFKVRAVNGQGGGAVSSKTAKPVAGADNLDYTWEYILSHLPAEFSISYKIILNDDYGQETFYSKVVRTSKGYYFEGEGGPENSDLYIKNGDKYDNYYYDYYEKKFVFNDGYPQSSQSSLDDKFLISCGIYMAPWATTTGFTKSGSQTIAGRSCDKYIFNAVAPGVNISYTYFIDKATGVCLKMTFEASAGSQYGGYEFECIEFKTTGVTLPSYES